MQQIYIKFEDAEQVMNFVNAISRVEENFELGSGKRFVNPKSILGVFTLDLAQPQRLKCNSDDLKLMDKLIPFLKKYVGITCANS